MSKNSKWYKSLEEYVRCGEPEREAKSQSWMAAIGLQDVDGLRVSDYLINTARAHIEGKISIDEVQNRIADYYNENEDRKHYENENKEADIVSARIANLLDEQAFQFSPAEWMMIHRRLFDGLFDAAGQIRDYNVTKDEWILGGDTVRYASYWSILDTMNYDFENEKMFSYECLPMDEVIKHIVKFTSDIWQIHPFCEGNTRATAVFIIKYLKTLGLELTNDVFAEHSWYFRNALVRANYNNLKDGIHATTKFLEMFFRNFLLGKDNELKNRYMHVDYKGEIVVKEEQMNYICNLK